MTSTPLTSLHSILSTLVRRYRLRALDVDDLTTLSCKPATALALLIERARVAVEQNSTPDLQTKRQFIDALAQMIRDAMRAEGGDPVFQAMVLRHHAPQVREYASLVAGADVQRRFLHATVNSVAHPAKLQRLPPGPQREALAQLQAAAASESWGALNDAVQVVLALPDIVPGSPLHSGVARLMDGPALNDVRRLDALAEDPLVMTYRSLWESQGPTSGSVEAAAQGTGSRRRGEAVEALAAQALNALASRLQAEDGMPYRVVTGMHVPASLGTDRDRAKSEWDAVLLRGAEGVDGTDTWEVCLLVEAKASVDAATTDLPKLVRGMQLLASAAADEVYAFQAREGVVHLRSGSLSTLTTDEAGLARSVLYCCDAPADGVPRLLGSAARMQLLSAQASVAYASEVLAAEGRVTVQVVVGDSEHPGATHAAIQILRTEAHAADLADLETVWTALLTAPSWHAVLNHQRVLRQVRALMVHPDDLLAAARESSD